MKGDVKNFSKIS